MHTEGEQPDFGRGYEWWVAAAAMAASARTLSRAIAVGVADGEQLGEVCLKDILGDLIPHRHIAGHHLRNHIPQ